MFVILTHLINKNSKYVNDSDDLQFNQMPFPY